jgi:hypothetical protein
VNCGSDKTNLGKHKLSDGTIKAYPGWHRKDGFDGYLCHKCYSRIELGPRNNKRKLNYRGKRIAIGDNIRIGVCNLCRAVSPFDCDRTVRHHTNGYDDFNKLKDTIEICPRCHRMEHYSNK